MPIGSRVNTKSPVAVVTVVVYVLGSDVLAVTVTAGSTAPLVSVTRPTMSAVPCANANVLSAREIGESAAQCSERDHTASFKFEEPMRS